MIPEEGYVVEKVLSANDCGLTGGHQAGALIPKEERILEFFPKLNGKEKNPRCVLHFIDDSGASHQFCFVHYNTKLLGCGTRNEFRLTRMTGYIRASGLGVGDVLVFSRKDGKYHVGFRKQASKGARQENGVILVCSGKWKIVHI
ncbi:MAG: hypothetical protein J6T45_06090 [Fibrobacterales bacterium]|nr:hypothetical protein [Fibrobacterales bacterium]